MAFVSGRRNLFDCLHTVQLQSAISRYVVFPLGFAVDSLKTFIPRIAVACKNRREIFNDNV